MVSSAAADQARNEKEKNEKESREKSRKPAFSLVAALVPEAVSAIDGLALRGFEGHFALLTAVGTSRLVHFTGCAEVSVETAAAPVHVAIHGPFLCFVSDAHRGPPLDEKEFGRQTLLPSRREESERYL
jgi:hypothetical protein